MEETTPEAVVQNTETPAATTPEKKADKTPGNIQGVLAYVFFLFIIAALQKLDDDTLMFHAKNGAGLTLLFIVASFVSAWISVLFGSIISLIWLIPSILGAFHGYKNEKWAIPGVSNWAQNIPLDHWFGKGHAENMKPDMPVEDETQENVEPTLSEPVMTPSETPVIQESPEVSPEPTPEPTPDQVKPAEEVHPVLEPTLAPPVPENVPAPKVEPIPTAGISIEPSPTQENKSTNTPNNPIS